MLVRDFESRRGEMLNLFPRDKKGWTAESHVVDPGPTKREKRKKKERAKKTKKKKKKKKKKNSPTPQTAIPQPQTGSGSKGWEHVDRQFFTHPPEISDQKNLPVWYTYIYQVCTYTRLRYRAKKTFRQSADGHQTAVPESCYYKIVNKKDLWFEINITPWETSGTISR